MSNFPEMEYKPVAVKERKREVDPTLDALRYLQAVYRGQVEAESQRMRAAMACLPFEMPKLSVVASVNDPAAFADRLEAAIRRSGINPRVIEHHRAIEHQPQPQPRQMLLGLMPRNRIERLRRL